MEFKVGSLMNLISGKSNSVELPNQTDQEKIIFKLKPKAACTNQQASKAKVDRHVNNRQSFNTSRYQQSKKSQTLEGRNFSLSSLQKFQKKFRQDNLTKSFKNRAMIQESRPEIAENSLHGVVGKSFKYTSSENTIKTGIDSTDGSEDKLERTVFVGNFPLAQISEKTVKTLFAPYGEIESFRLRSVPLKDLRFSRKVAAIKADFHPDRTSTNMYVVMKSKAAAEAAQALNGTVVDNHHLRVDKASTPKENDPRKTIFLGNVSFKAEEDDLWALFEQCGDIEYVRIIRDKETSVSKGAAYVNFTSADSVELALKMEGTAEIHGRMLKIHRCLPGQKKSFNPASSRQPVPRNTTDNPTKDDRTRAKEEKRFQKKMIRRQKREAENAKNEALGLRSRPLKDPSSDSQTYKAFIGVKAEDKKQKKKKKKFNKGEVQRKKFAKILASVKSDTVKEKEPPKVVKINEPSSSSIPTEDGTSVTTQGLSKKLKKHLNGGVQKAAPQTILLQHQGQLKKKKLKKVKTKLS